MWIWETREQKAERELSNSLAGCLGPIFGFFFILALIGHFFTKAGDAVYYPFVQNWPFTEERKVEIWLRDIFGHSYIYNIPNKEHLLSFFAEGSVRERKISDVQKIEEGFYGARLYPEVSKLSGRFDRLLDTWKVDDWRRENIDRIFIENHLFNTSFLKKDLNRDLRQPILAYLLSNGRITINKQLVSYIKSERLRDYAGRRLKQLRTDFNRSNASLPKGWENRIVEAPNLKRLADWNLKELIIPLGVLILVVIIIKRQKN